MKVGVVGTGHVGLVTCATLASVGHDVVGHDSDDEKIAQLESGAMPFFEPGLEELVKEQVASGRLRFTTQMAETAADADVVFLCVGTPPRASGDANLVAVEASAREVARHATGRLLVVEKSTVPAGTFARLRAILRRERKDIELDVASNPEFLREGKAIEDMMQPERILVGADSDWAFEIMRKVYEPITSQGYTMIETDIATAEISKHASNAFLAMKISFANALARVCELAGADVVKVTEAMGLDHRIGKDFLGAGLGYGGSCFPKDLRAFDRLSASLGYEFPMLREIARINLEAVQVAAKKVEDALWNLEGKRVVLLGLAFKPGTDDVRFSPALELGKILHDKGAVVIGYDPEANANAKSEMPELEVVEDLFEAVTGANCVVVCTEWPEIVNVDLARLNEAMAEPIVVDGRNAFDPKAMAAAGFTYFPTGRPPVIPS